MKDEPQKVAPFAEKLIDAPIISQYPDLPTGCESVAAVMVFQYYSIDITPKEFVYSYSIKIRASGFNELSESIL